MTRNRRQPPEDALSLTLISLKKNGKYKRFLCNRRAAAEAGTYPEGLHKRDKEITVGKFFQTDPIFEYSSKMLRVL